MDRSQGGDLTSLPWDHARHGNGRQERIKTRDAAAVRNWVAIAPPQGQPGQSIYFLRRSPGVAGNQVTVLLTTFDSALSVPTVVYELMAKYQVPAVRPSMT